MKVLGIASFSPEGEKIADCLSEGFSEEFEIDRCKKGWKDWVGTLFASGAAGIIFVGASGIAVRLIAPYLKSKTSDPAVLVIDEAGQFVISLLSGHLGGANALARRAAALLGATPVITTGTDVQGKFAADVFAQHNNLLIGSLPAAKEVSSDILWGEKVALYCEKKIFGKMPPELTPVKEGELGSFGEFGALICISEKSPEELFPKEALPKTVLHLIPKCYFLGIGCKKGKQKDEIESLIGEVLDALGISIRQVAGVASVENKKEEPGLHMFCESFGLPFAVYPADVLRKVPGTVSSSAFVEEITGVDNVCESAALKMAGKNAILISRKTAGNGVTAAVAKGDWSVSFEY